MDFFQLIKTAFNSLNANKMRTALTVLGIVIGIASVISMISIGAGTQASVKSSFSSLGTNTLTISPGSQRTGLVQGGAGSATTLTIDDAKSLLNSIEIPNLAAVSPETSRNAQVTANENNTNVQITGVWPDYLAAHDYNLLSGNFISQDNVDSETKVAVVGYDTANNLFGSTEILGEIVRINNINFKIIGITAQKGSASGFFNQDDFIAIPLSVAQKSLFGQSGLRSIVIKVNDEKNLTQAQDDITALLLKRHKIADATSADFTIRNSTDTLNALSSVTGVFTILLASIAGISLVVGGIGIMNIMIVTITERTREIGLRKAVGAKNKSILLQFLTESVVLTSTGGILGVLSGIGISYLIQIFANTTTIVTIESVLLSLGVSIVIGLVFGIYPAYKASKMSPIEALRYE